EVGGGAATARVPRDEEAMRVEREPVGDEGERELAQALHDVAAVGGDFARVAAHFPVGPPVRSDPGFGREDGEAPLVGERAERLNARVAGPASAVEKDEERYRSGSRSGGEVR